MYSHIRGPLQHWIAGRAAGFWRGIVVGFWMYSTDISAINLSWSSSSQTVPITSLPPFSSNHYHQLFPFSGRSTRSPLVLAKPRILFFVVLKAKVERVNESVRKGDFVVESCH